MNSFRDTATLAILILLALTVRLDRSDKPLEIDLTSPAEASTAQANLVSGPEAAAHPAPCSGTAPIYRMSQMPRRIVVPAAAVAQERQFVWKVDGKRVAVILDTIETVSAPAPEERDEPSVVRHHA